MAGVSNNVIGLSHLINVVPAGIVYCFAGTLIVTVGSQPLISNTNPLLIFIMLLLYYITIIALAFCISYMSDSGKLILPCYFYICYILYFILVTEVIKMINYLHSQLQRNDGSINVLAAIFSCGFVRRL